MKLNRSKFVHCPNFVDQEAVAQAILNIFYFMFCLNSEVRPLSQLRLFGLDNVPNLAGPWIVISRGFDCIDRYSKCTKIIISNDKLLHVF